MKYQLKRYDIPLLPKNTFTGGSFYKKKGSGVDGEGGGGVGRGGDKIKKKENLYIENLYPKNILIRRML